MVPVMAARWVHRKDIPAGFRSTKVVTCCDSCSPTWRLVPDGLPTRPPSIGRSVGRESKGRRAHGVLGRRRLPSETRSASPGLGLASP